MNDELRKGRIKDALQTVQAYKTVFSSPDGQAVLIDLMKKCRVLEPVTDVGNGGGFSVVSAFYDGKRSAVLDVFKMLGYDESRLIELFKLAGEKQNGL